MIDCSDKKSCCGCSACAQICPTKSIEMKPDYEGFLYPNIDKKTCIDCGKCDIVCPFKKSMVEERSVKVLGAINTNDHIRRQSSSGGIFFELGKAILNKNGVVFGVRLTQDCLKAEHIMITNEEELKELQGSKYIQSEIGNTYIMVREKLIENRMVLFSGTPCQISGLNSFLGKKYDNLICVEVICHRSSIN